MEFSCVIRDKNYWFHSRVKGICNPKKVSPQLSFNPVTFNMPLRYRTPTVH